MKITRFTEKNRDKKVFHNIDRPTTDGSKNVSRRKPRNSDVTAL
jgi:hypothetical protein